MFPEIQVMADGSVHCGGNHWFSLEDIQRAVLAKTSGIHSALNDNQAQMEHRVKPQIQFVGRKQTEAELRELIDQAKQFIQENERFHPLVNSSQEALPLPSTVRAGARMRTMTANRSETEHLPLPSTMRNVC